MGISAWYPERGPLVYPKELVVPERGTTCTRRELVVPERDPVYPREFVVPDRAACRSAAASFDYQEERIWK
jgi:hypothetical protein